MTTVSPAGGFKIHAAIFVVVVIVNIGINILTGPPWWSIWVFFPWVVGVAAHWFFTHTPKPF